MFTIKSEAVGVKLNSLVMLLVAFAKVVYYSTIAVY